MDPLDPIGTGPTKVFQLHGVPPLSIRCESFAAFPTRWCEHNTGATFSLYSALSACHLGF